MDKKCDYQQGPLNDLCLTCGATLFEHFPLSPAPVRWDPNKSAYVPMNWNELQGMKRG